MQYRVTPGHVLQFNHIKRRLSQNKSCEFIEVGAGSGLVSRVLLEEGMAGIAFDLNAQACKSNVEFNKNFIKNRQYQVLNEDFFSFEPTHKVDIVLSCMVIEHFPPELLDQFFKKAKQLLKPNGKIVTLVPGSQNHWGIEDEVAGHQKRYERKDFEALAQQYNLEPVHTYGLTYPLSNVLLKLSNFLIARNEKHKLKKNLLERTIDSGYREVAFKTTFPWYFKLIINEVVLFPFILLQRIFHKNPNCLVIYNEMILKA